MFTNLISVIVLFFADRLFKIAAVKYFSDELTVLIPGFIGIKVLEGGNTGAAFGILSDNTELLAVLSLIVSLILIVLLILNSFEHVSERWGYILLCAGALGNLYDRVIEKTVTDYLEFLFIDFPVFNFADILVDVGCLLLFINIFFFDNSKKLAVEESNDRDEYNEK